MKGILWKLGLKLKLPVFSSLLPIAHKKLTEIELRKMEAQDI